MISVFIWNQVCCLYNCRDVFCCMYRCCCCCTNSKLLLCSVVRHARHAIRPLMRYRADSNVIVFCYYRDRYIFLSRREFPPEIHQTHSAGQTETTRPSSSSSSVVCIIIPFGQIGEVKKLQPQLAATARNCLLVGNVRTTCKVWNRHHARTPT